MSEALLIPLQVYGIGFIISFGIAILIKGMLWVIRKFTKEEQAEEVKSY